MTSRRDWQLQQLGITQWSLRRPGALQGEIAISLPEHIRLVMVAETNSWRLGTEASLPLAGAQVSTPAFDELQTSVPARRALWQQICAHEHDFYPQHG